MASRASRFLRIYGSRVARQMISFARLYTVSRAIADMKRQRNWGLSTNP